jgi:hypothetical protein
MFRLPSHLRPQMPASRSFPSQLTTLGMGKSFSGRSMLWFQTSRLWLFGCEAMRTLSSGVFWESLGAFMHILTCWLEANHDYASATEHEHSTPIQRPTC